MTIVEKPTLRIEEIHRFKRAPLLLPDQPMSFAELFDAA
jgi:hypothetical protein